MWCNLRGEFQLPAASPATAPGLWVRVLWMHLGPHRRALGSLWGNVLTPLGGLLEADCGLSGASSTSRGILGASRRVRQPLVYLVECALMRCEPRGVSYVGQSSCPSRRSAYDFFVFVLVIGFFAARRSAFEFFSLCCCFLAFLLFDDLRLSVVVSAICFFCVSAISL